MKFEMTGIEEMTRELEKMTNDIAKYENEAVNEAGEYYQKKVIENAPMKTGNLRRHIERTEAKDAETTIFVDQQGKAYYGVMVEEGTSKMRARPYMYPTYQREVNKLIAIMADVLRKRLSQ